MKEEKIFYQRNLPHYQPRTAIYFITFRLAGSLPKVVVEELRRENEIIENKIKRDNDFNKLNKLLYSQRKRYFKKFDKLLDEASSGPLWLRNEKVAEVVADAIHYRDGKEYELYAFCIMPNHVHMMFSVSRIFDSTTRNSVSSYIATKILQGLKEFSAIKANKILKRSGQFWQHESYDHVVRNSNEFDKIVDYIVQNPVKAGFVKNWEEWKWNYVNLYLYKE